MAEPKEDPLLFDPHPDLERLRKALEAWAGSGITAKVDPQDAVTMLDSVTVVAAKLCRIVANALDGLREAEVAREAEHSRRLEALAQASAKQGSLFSGVSR